MGFKVVGFLDQFFTYSLIHDLSVHVPNNRVV